MLTLPNKQTQPKYGHVPPKLVIMTPWQTLCVGLIGPYTLKGNDGTSIYFVCLTMIDLATSWFEINISCLETVLYNHTFGVHNKGKGQTLDL